MKKWMKNVMLVVAALGFSEKAKDGTITSEEIKAVCDEYEKQFGVSLESDKAANLDAEAPVLTAEEVKSIADTLGVSADTVPASAKDAAMAAAQEAQAREARIKNLEEQVAKMASEPEQVQAAQARALENAGKMAKVCGLSAHTPGYLFGIEHEAFSRGKWYNQMMVTRKSREISNADLKEFKAGFAEYADCLQERLAYLNGNNLIGALNFADMIKGEGVIDYSDLYSKAGEYIVRRTDLIIAYLRSLPSVSGIFPVVSGVQNKEVAPTANFGGLSQGYREGRIFKGNVKFSAEIYQVDDLMFKYNFTQLERLEKQYIGYLNREGSNVIKWTFIEWILVSFGEILIREQNARRVAGVRVPQQAVTANPANFAADGILRAIERAEESFKVLPFSTYGTYTKQSILDTVEGMWDKFCEVVPSVDGYKIYLNARHKQWYIRAYRSKYGDDADFTGSNAQLVDLAPDNIVWVPNMPLNCFKIWITLPGNVENLEFVPGEMNAFNFTPEFEGIVASSRWKEGAHVQQAGVQYASKSALAASNYKDQYLFTNFPISALTIAEGVIDVSANQVFELDNHATTTGTGENAVTTPAADITTVNKYAEDQCIKFVAKAAGDSITKAGAFSKLATAFTAGAAGDYIVVYPEFEDVDVTVDGVATKATQPTGKFLELRRSVTA